MGNDILSQKPEVKETASGFFARRGSQDMSKDDLQAHLAALVRLENVGVLLGSGCSVGDLGGMTMGMLWEDFCSQTPESLAWLKSENFVCDDSDRPGKTPNVEELADALEVARLEWKRQGLGDHVKSLDEVRADLQRAVIWASILKEDWWKNPELADDAGPELAAHRDLLHKLTAARQPGHPAPWVFTTNYDLAVEWAAESIGLKVCNGFDGLHHRVFAPHNFDLGYRNTLARGEARFGTYSIYLAKLHGSLTWRTSNFGMSYTESPASQLWPDIEKFIAGGAGSDGAAPVVFPSAAKYMQTVGFVLGELLRRFTDVLSRPQSCLITCGYSFSDEHINRIIASSLQNPTLQLVIFLPEAKLTAGKLDVSDCKPWVRRIARLESPQVTLVGGGPEAYFDGLVRNLPDPVLFDEQATKIRDMLKEYRESREETGNKSKKNGVKE